MLICIRCVFRWHFRFALPYKLALLFLCTLTWSFSYPDILFPAAHYNTPCLCNASWDQKETESDQDDEVIQTLSFYHYMRICANKKNIYGISKIWLQNSQVICILYALLLNTNTADSQMNRKITWTWWTWYFHFSMLNPVALFIKSSSNRKRLPSTEGHSLFRGSLPPAENVILHQKKSLSMHLFLLKGDLARRVS